MPSFLVSTTVDVEVDAEFQVWCANCGAGLCGNMDNKRHSSPEFTITPCEKCLKEAEDAGYEKGHDAGLNEARKES